MRHMKNHKRGMVLPLGTIALLAVIALGAWWMFGSPNDSLSATGTRVTVTQSGQAASLCSVEDTTFKHNDIDRYASGTDPASTAKVLAGGDIAVGTTVADDGTLTVSPGDKFRILAGENSATYFSELESVEVACKGTADFAPQLSLAGAPTITVLNDNGATVNSDSNDEAMGASGTYTHTFSVRAPNDACASKHGAILAIEYDATYYSKFESSLAKSGQAIYLTHNSTGHCVASTCDQWTAFEFPEALCDNAKAEFTVTVTTTDTQPTEDINYAHHWLPKDFDVNADTGSELLGIFDEDNNAIYLGNQSGTVSAS